MFRYRFYIVIACITVICSVFFSVTTQGQAEIRKQIESECYTSEFPILMYHHIRPYTGLHDISAQNLSVSPEEFDEQMQYFKDAGWNTLHIKDIKGNSVPCKSFLITFDDGYYDVYKYAAPIMKKYGYTGVISLITASIDESDYMSGDQIRELLNNNWEIASHTWTHPILTRSPLEKVEIEIKKSKSDLEQWFGEPLSVFVYPGGFYGPETLKKVSESRYRFGFTTQQGYAKLGTKNLELKRFNIAPGTTKKKLQKLLERKPTP